MTRKDYIILAEFCAQYLDEEMTGRLAAKLRRSYGNFDTNRFMSYVAKERKAWESVF